MAIDPCKIAFLTEALEGFSVPELQFLASYIHVRLTRLTAYIPTTISAPTTSAAHSGNVSKGVSVRDEDLVPPPIKSTSLSSNEPLLQPAAVQERKSGEIVHETTEARNPEPAPITSPTPTVGNEVSVDKEVSTDFTKKNVKWADIVTAPPPGNSVNAQVKKKVYQKTPQATKTVPSAGKSATPKSATTLSAKKKIVERHSVDSAPRDEAYPGKSWSGFCGNDDHGCVYTFRDPCSEVNADGKPVPPPRRHDTKGGDDDAPLESQEQVAWDSDRLDAVRFDRGQIYDNQLYVRGWNPDIVSWEMVRERLWNELSDYQLDIHQIFVNSKGFGFITLSNHDVATKCQKVLADLPSFYGDQLLVNFATSRK